MNVRFEGIAAQMKERQVERAVFRSDLPCEIHKEASVVTGPTVSGAQLQHLVQEITSGQQQEQLERMGSTRVSQQVEGCLFEVDIRHDGGGLEVAITRAGQVGGNASNSSIPHTLGSLTAPSPVVAPPVVAPQQIASPQATARSQRRHPGETEIETSRVLPVLCWGLFLLGLLILIPTFMLPGKAWVDSRVYGVALWAPLPLLVPIAAYQSIRRRRS